MPPFRVEVSGPIREVEAGPAHFGQLDSVWAAFPADPCSVSKADLSPIA
jgi:hypothetical protein